MQFYLNPAREQEATALPDAEVFERDDYLDRHIAPDGEPYGSGFYWWASFPGCLADSDPVGPFDTEALVIADAQSGAE